MKDERFDRNEAEQSESLSEIDLSPKLFLLVPKVGFEYGAHNIDLVRSDGQNKAPAIGCLEVPNLIKIKIAANILKNYLYIYAKIDGKNT